VRKADLGRGGGEAGADGGSEYLYARFWYNANGRRIAAAYNEDQDPGLTEAVFDDNQVEFFAYDDLWRLRAVYAREAGQAEATCRERYAYNPAGMNGKPSSAPLDSPLFGQIDVAGDGTFERSFYLIQNTLGDVIKIVEGAGGTQHEEIRYTLYGEPYIVNWLADMNQDGRVDGDDLVTFFALWDVGAFGSDTNGDGGVDGDDVIQFLAWWDNGEGAGRTTADNRFGFRGYVWDDRLQMYHVRHRVYDPMPGPAGLRWLQRDPAFFVDGLNLYAYCGGDPVNGVDPLGLWDWDGDWIQYGAGGLIGVHGAEPARAGAQGAADGFVVSTNAAASSLTFGALGKDLESLRESGILFDPENEMLEASEFAGSISGELLQEAFLGGLGKFAKCGTYSGRAIKEALRIKSALDRINGIVDAADSAMQIAQLIEEGRYEDAAKAAAMMGAQALADELLARAGKKFADAIPCFAADTPVATAVGEMVIEDVRVGDRVLTASESDEAASTEVDPATWRLFHLELGGGLVAGSDSRAGELELLRPVSWFVANAAKDRAGVVWVYLDIAEWDLRGWAKVKDILPCPAIKPGVGHVVLMKSVTRYEGRMAAATFVGHPTPLVGTHTHPVYSEDRCGYVGLGDLEVGERVRTAEGWATVEAMARWWGSATVHNLEVEAQHRFLAGAAGVVSHNAGGGGGSCFGESCGGPKQTNEGIYEFPGRSGKKYVGQSGNIDRRLAQHERSGKLAPEMRGEVVRTPVPGGKTAREVAEQRRIDELGGLDHLENQRNPIGPNRKHLLDDEHR